MVGVFDSKSASEIQISAEWIGTDKQNKKMLVKKKIETTHKKENNEETTMR